MEEKDEVEYSMDFYQQLREQTMGPWRRALFTEVGGGEASTSDPPSGRYTIESPVDTDSDPEDFYFSDHDSDTGWFVPPVSAVWALKNREQGKFGKFREQGV